MKIEKKVQQKYFEAVLEGKKRFEDIEKHGLVILAIRKKFKFK